MQTICFTAFKGGSGKTTALMAVASALVARGHRVGVFEADDNEPLKVWKKYAADLGTWDARCDVHPATDLASFAENYDAAENAGTDYALIDTRGGGSDLNQAAMTNADLIVLPTSLSPMEVDESLATIEHAVDLLDRAGVEVPIVLLVNRVASSGKVSAPEQVSLNILADLPVLDARLPDRSIFNEVKAVGLLHHYHRKLAETPARRILATHTKVAVTEADAITDELLARMASMEAA